MYYFVKSELPRDKVNQFTDDLAEGKIRGVEENIAYVTPDGVVGYDIVECRDENDCRQKYSDLTDHGLQIDEITPVESMSDFIKERKGKSL